MPLTNVCPDSLLHGKTRLRRRLREQRVVYVFGREAGGFAHDDFTAFVVPLEDGSRPNAKLLSYLRRN
jgi:hypothetical protein